MCVQQHPQVYNKHRFIIDIENRGFEMQQARHAKIKELLAQTGFVNVQDLSDRLGVTTETIRRDLEQLEKDGSAKRVRGGAMSLLAPARSQSESAYDLRKEENAEEKQAIARAAADLINEGDTVILSSGTTVLEVAKNLKGKKDVTVITNSLPVALELSDAEGISLFCLGGFVRSDDYSVAGNMSTENLRVFNPNKLVTGIGGLTVENGLTDYRMDESSLLREFFDRTEIAIGVADHSKFSKVARYNICPASRLDYLVTTDATPQAELSGLKEIGIKVVVANL